MSIYCRNVRKIWTSIYLHLRTKILEFDLDFSSENAEDNLHKLFNFFEMVSDISTNLYIKYDVDSLENEKNTIRDQIFVSIFDENVKRCLDSSLHIYCRTLFEYLDNGDDEYVSEVVEKMHKIMSTCPILLENVFKEIFFFALNDYLQRFIRLYDHEFNVKVLESLIDKKTKLIENKVIPHLFPQTKNSSSKFRLSLDYLYEIYFDIRIESIFEIIMEYPDSEQALKELEICVSALKNVIKLCQKLKSEISERLLHPAVASPDLINAYIFLIKAMRILDPNGSFEDYIMKDVKNYLMTREDTINAIVKKIVNYDEETENFTECDLNQTIPAKFVPKNYENEGFNVRCTSRKMNEWVPHPKNIFFNNDLHFRSMDILGSLLNIYNSHEFIKEYKNILSEELIKQDNFDVDKNVRILEKLKQRFGSENLRDCEIMFNDIWESRRMNKVVAEKMTASATNTDFQITPNIISSKYWPKLDEDIFEIPDTWKSTFNNYAKQFKECNHQMDLKFHNMLGSFVIKLQINDKEVEMEVTLLQAAIIQFFSEASRWELAKLSEKLHLKISAVRRAIQFWIHQGFLKSVNKTDSEAYETIQEDVDDKRKELNYLNDDDEEELKDVNLERDIYPIVWNFVSEDIKRKARFKQPSDINKLFFYYENAWSEGPKLSREQFQEFLNEKVLEQFLVKSGDNYLLNDSKK